MNDQQYQLIVNKGPVPEQVFELSSVSMAIGRDPMCEITINDPEVSRRHANLIGTLTGYRIQDLGSTNGTFVDGVRLGGEPLELESGQVISIGGGVVLLYQATADIDEHSQTALDMEMASPESFQLQEQPEFIAAEPSEDEIEDSSISLGAEDEIDDSGMLLGAEDDILVAETDSIVEHEAEQEPEEEYSPPATVWETPQDEQPSLPDLDDAKSYEPDNFAEPVVIPHQGEPTEPPPAGQNSSFRRTSTIVAAVLLLLICCCCSLLLFMYYVGGDWLLRQMGLLP